MLIALRCVMFVLHGAMEDHIRLNILGSVSVLTFLQSFAYLLNFQKSNALAIEVNSINSEFQNFQNSISRNSLKYNQTLSMVLFIYKTRF